jgi:small subunit ribosomal protein S6
MVHTRIYESVIILNATLEDAQIETEIEKVKDFIQKNNGEIRAVEKWGRRRLAYPIKKKNNGFYVLYEFKTSGELIAKLERHYHLNENIIRFLTIQMDKKALKAKEVGQKTPATEAPPAAAAVVEEKGVTQ